MGEPFDIYNGSKSPWEVFCVPREDGQECAVIFKFHHCLMDAAGFSVLLSDMFLDERLAGLGGAQRAKNCAERWKMDIVGYFNSARWLFHQVHKSYFHLFMLIKHQFWKCCMHTYALVTFPCSSHMQQM
jgi:hypothetical protein